ncbi:hypothetical protein DYBT9275_00052 [Dyadobacter sp. CECT 9275]|uniref:3-keto-alpha-glucoside-1,2-lyase/3-keto-2-hydroxy-glucal hydratase domain-containing protein n=1 Tax=Dyadobacter helix TaxID=2822344 RepID=A0A916J782_9BACT|nr:DUF1080 domain-containing protein [Dyadobacter sp. CECT 9275]CAG4988315.1 hypothetical protein DYBT9275_00052 [Dyadobacter sp. CECT 9275]
MNRRILNSLIFLSVAALVLSFAARPSDPFAADRPTEIAKKGKWVSLFDGKSFDGWHSYLKKEVLPQWKIEDGAIMLSEKGGGDLLTNKAYENFELELEWKISEGGNSGIVYHVREDPAFKSADVTGLEMQVLDNERHPNAKQGADRTAGSLFDMVAPSDSTACKPAGEWNKARLVVNNSKAEHFLNNKKIVQYQIGGAEWDRLISQSKFKDWKYLGKFKTGHIALQDHGNKVWYRNVKIREL